MKESFFRIFSFFAFALGIANQNALVGTPRYETYLESWQSDWYTVMTGLPPTPSTSSTSYNNVTLGVFDHVQMVFDHDHGVSLC